MVSIKQLAEIKKNCRLLHIGLPLSLPLNPQKLTSQVYC